MRIYIIVFGLIVAGIIAFYWTGELNQIEVGTLERSVSDIISGGGKQYWKGAPPEAVAAERANINSKYGIWLVLTLVGATVLSFTVPSNRQMNIERKAIRAELDQLKEDGTISSWKKEDDVEKNGMENCVDQNDAYVNIAILKNKITELEKEMEAMTNHRFESETGYIECPCCMEKIRKGAMICRFCRSDLKGSL